MPRLQRAQLALGVARLATPRERACEAKAILEVRGVVREERAILACGVVVLARLQQDRGELRAHGGRVRRRLRRGLRSRRSALRVEWLRDRKKQRHEQREPDTRAA